MTPTPELLIEIFTKQTVEDGYRILVDQGYTYSRVKCTAFRNALRAKGLAEDPRKVWTDERIEKVREMAGKGCNSKAIAAELGTSRHAIQRLCVTRKIPLRKGNAVQVPTREEVDALYQGRSILAASVVMGVADTTFRRWVRYYGLTRPEPVKPAPVEKPSITLVKPMRNACYRPADLPPPETGPAADAARYLRYVGYSNVYRRSAKEWWVGRGPMTEADMIARAEEIKARKERLRA